MTLKKHWLFLFALSGFGLSVAFAGVQKTANSLQNDVGQASYAMGFQTGQAFKKHSIELSSQLFAKGMQDGLTGKLPKLTVAQMKGALKTFQQQNLAKMQKQMSSSAKKNQQMGAAFLAANKNKPGVKSTASGLQYKVLKAGSGATPTKSSTVTVNYVGKLINGKVFDSSYKRGKPATFNLSQVIPGWTEALALMKTGATWEIYVPGKLAYGQNGIPGAIGPNETLIFKVHLIQINKQAQ